MGPDQPTIQGPHFPRKGSICQWSEQNQGHVTQRIRNSECLIVLETPQLSCRTVSLPVGKKALGMADMGSQTQPACLPACHSGEKKLKAQAIDWIWTVIFTRFLDQQSHKPVGVRYATTEKKNSLFPAQNSSSQGQESTPDSMGEWGRGRRRIDQKKKLISSTFQEKPGL